MTYDWAGNMTSDGTWDYTFNAENQLSKMTRITATSPTGDAERLEFVYDYLGRRVEKRSYTAASGGTLIETIRFVYDGWNLILETNATGTIQRTYAWGLDASGSVQGAGGVGGLLHFRSGGVTYLPMYDTSHNIVGWTRATDGAVMQATSYNAFGEVQQSWTASGFAGAAKFGFSTKYTDSETGLVYYGYRYYHPKLGRFINRDPIGDAGGTNLYGFVGNNPVNLWDLLGLNYIRIQTGWETRCYDDWVRVGGHWVYGFVCVPTDVPVYDEIWIGENENANRPGSGGDGPAGPTDGNGSGNGGQSPGTEPNSNGNPSDSEDPQSEEVPDDPPKTDCERFVDDLVSIAGRNNHWVRGLDVFQASFTGSDIVEAFVPRNASLNANTIARGLLGNALRSHRFIGLSVTGPDGVPTGFIPDLVAGGQNEAVARHVVVSAALALNYQSFGTDLLNYIDATQSGPGRGPGMPENLAEVAGNNAGREAGFAIRSFHHDRITAEQLHDRLMDTLCQQ